ncbi:T-cell receptor beta chain V region CTL-L17 [Cricetulus griseus]|nr:T-cell receptor beta chain V region CTL-L17 [Cricetulus griseus]
MGPICLPHVIFCLLGAACVDAMVTQNPRYKVARVGKAVNLSCSQNLNHNAMYWYRQKPNQGPKFLLYYYDSTLNKEADTSDNFQSSRPNNSFCLLDIRSAGLGDSAMYLCASSRDTGLRHHPPSVHKHSSLPDPSISSRTTPPFLQQ